MGCYGFPRNWVDQRTQRTRLFSQYLTFDVGYESFWGELVNLVLVFRSSIDY